VKVPVVERAQTQTTIGTGFQPGEVVTGVMHSTPLALGTQVANAAGTVTFVWTVPTSTDLGVHTVTLTGATSGAVTGSFKVVAAGLATTGHQPGYEIPIAILLMLLGGSAITFSRRRTRNAVSRT
jgi:hypothetical protein